MRTSTLKTLCLPSVLEIIEEGQMPVNTQVLVDKVFGKDKGRGCMVISGASGIVGAGKVMQFSSRLLPFGIPIVALDMPGAPDGIGRQYKGLIKSFGKDKADSIMKNIIRLTYDGKTLPESLDLYKPKFLLEAIPEILELKKSHYDLFRKRYPGIPIYSVTSGFPSSQLGVNIAHPAFPHEINKIFEIVEEKPTVISQLLWSLGLIPIPVSDHWSFVLDVYFCGLMLSALHYQRVTNTPYWKIDKLVRKLVGPNPFRAHDAIGAKGSNFLTWSCLHHLSKEYGPLFEPTPDLVEHKDSGQNWYPPDHFRPMVNWQLSTEDLETLNVLIHGPLMQMTSIMVKENRSNLALITALSELCAQFTKGPLAVSRKYGEKNSIDLVKAFHKIVPAASKTKWYPEVFKQIKDPEWQQLYVNAEQNGKYGTITISRESYNSDVDAELNRAIDWLKTNKIKRVVITSDFHLSTQMVGADTTEFYPALLDKKAGEQIAKNWSTTARRLYNEFEISVGLVTGKRCMGGMLELMMHCHYLICEEQVMLAMPEVTLPVVPGMEGCHWALRKAPKAKQKDILNMLLTGEKIKAGNATGWLVDYSSNLNACLKMTRQVMIGGTKVLKLRKVNEKALGKLPFAGIATSGGHRLNAMKAIMNCIEKSCAVDLHKALEVQATLSAEFMLSQECQAGSIGAEFKKVMSS